MAPVDFFCRFRKETLISIDVEKTFSISVCIRLEVVGGEEKRETNTIKTRKTTKKQKKT